MPPLKVAIVSRAVYPLHGFGGLERHVHDLVRHLAAEGVEVALITSRPRATSHGPRTTDHAPRTASVRLLTVPYRTFPFAGRRGTTILDRITAYPVFGERAGKLAWDLVQRGEADIVHGLGAAVLGYARRRARASAPLVLNPQGLEEFGGTDPSRARAKRAAYLPLRRAVLACARAADAVIATDRSLEPVLLQHLRISRDKVHLIPNAIDVAAIDALAPGEAERLRRAAGLPADMAVLLSVGRLEANKGFGVLVEALAALLAHDALPRRWKWVLVGDGPNRRPLEQAIDRSGLQEHALVTGRVTDAELHAWYEAATLFVHPTLYEGSSLVTLEAMAHGKAVVASNAGGLPDKVRPGVNGWLVEPGEPAALGAAISGALGQPLHVLHTMGEAGRQIVVREFAWPAVARRTLDLYTELLSQPVACGS